MAINLYVQYSLRCEHIIAVFNFTKFLLYDVKLLGMANNDPPSRATTWVKSHGQAWELHLK